MIVDLKTDQIEGLLHSELVGRIGCFDGKSVYVVPISYAYDDGYIYCHAFEGKKINIMRKNPAVCFQVDKMTDMGNWKSVIAWGDYQELTDKQQINEALRILLKRPLPVISSITTHLGDTWPFTIDSSQELNSIPGVVFRISLTKKTGRSETTSQYQALC